MYTHVIRVVAQSESSKTVTIKFDAHRTFFTLDPKAVFRLEISSQELPNAHYVTYQQVLNPHVYVCFFF
jgi:hypothetical protein